MRVRTSTNGSSAQQQSTETLTQQNEEAYEQVQKTEFRESTEIQTGSEFQQSSEFQQTSESQQSSEFQQTTELTQTGVYRSSY